MIKVSVQTANRIRYPRTFVEMIGGKPSIKKVGLGISFQAGYNKYMVTASLEKYALASAEAAYEYPRKQAII